jgi:putative PIN family toxin of toxin-antitoxin system
VTLDTNVLISGTFWTGNSFRILEAIDRKEMMLVLSEEILAEYRRIEKSEDIMDKIALKSLILSKTAKRAVQDATIVNPLLNLDVITDDPSDNKILEYAVAGDADYIVSNDWHLLRLKEFRGIKIVTPEEFVDLFLTPKTRAHSF